MQRNASECELIKWTKNWCRYRTNHFATWNVRGLNGKEVELVEEIKKVNIAVTALTETKMTGQGFKWFNDGFLLFYSSVPKTERATTDVGFLVHKDYMNKVR